MTMKVKYMKNKAFKKKKTAWSHVTLQAQKKAVNHPFKNINTQIKWSV